MAARVVTRAMQLLAALAAPVINYPCVMSESFFPRED
jgi:hypothetical protein